MNTKILASAIQAYAASELDGYSYHGDGSAIEALKNLQRDAEGIAQYATTHRDWVEVESIVRSMMDIADHSAFIKRDPYDFTAALRKALGLPEVDG